MKLKSIGPFKKYLYGYVWGWKRRGEYSEYLHEKQVRYGKTKFTPECYGHEAVIYKTKEEAIAAAKKIYVKYHDELELFWRAYIYETNNPENAEGMILFEEVKETFGLIYE